MTRRRLLLGGAGVALAAGAFAAGRAPGAAAIERENPPRGAFVEVQGVAVHHVLAGPEDGPAVVLIHGASGNLNDMTYDLGPRLAAAGFRVAAFDRPGLGHTPRPRGREWWRPLEQAALLRGAAAALGLRRPVLLGHSWGAAVAMGWAVAAEGAADAPAGVVSVSGATMPWREGGDGALTPLVTSRVFAALGAAVLRAATAGDGGAGAVGRIFRPQAAPEGYLEWLQAELILRTASFRANSEDIQKLNRALRAQAEGYGRVSVPVEILHGGADTITGAAIHAEGLAAALARAPVRVEVLEGVGHMLHHARPDTVVAAVARVLPT